MNRGPITGQTGGQGSLGEFRLSQLQNRLAQLAGEALRHTDEDPRVVVCDRYGGTCEIGNVDIDWAPETLAEAESEVRHPVIRILPPEASR